MKNPNDVRINVYLTQDTHTRLKAWAAARGQTIQGAVSVSIGEMVAKVELPRMPPPLTTQWPKPTVPAWEPEPPPEFDPRERYFDLIDEMWVPEAKAQMERECRERGITGWLAPPLHQHWWANYRKRCEAAGRDYEEDFYV
jgi:hypothetical protein